MNILDVRTVLFSYGISNAICAAVMASLWSQNRRRSPELGFWLADFILQAVAVLLIALRGILPDFISILFGTPLVVGGTLLLYIGLERYTQKTTSQVHNYILLAVLFILHAYFTFLQPSLLARNLIFSAGLLVICSQIAWLLLRRVGPEHRSDARATAAVFVIYALVSLLRIFIDLVVKPGNDLFQSDLYDTLVILAYQMLFIGLTFAMFLMVNRRLFGELQNDILERNRVEEQVRSLSRFPVENPNPILRIARNGEILYANPASTPILSAWGRQVGQELTGDWRAQIGSVFVSGKTTQVEMDHQGRIFLCYLTPIPNESYINIYASDITQRKQAEEAIKAYSERLEGMVEERTRELRLAQEKLVRHEKLVVLGQLAGSVSHELRNPLGVISNAVYYLNMSQRDVDPKVKEYLDIIEKETRTADKIITDLLDFSRIKSVVQEPVDAIDLVEGVLERFPAPPGVQVSLKFPGNLPKICADPHHLSQVVGNLLVNAYQAMPDPAIPGAFEGKVDISGKLVDAVGLEQEDGQAFVAIAVEDCGVGISPENIGKLFEPLFTTKARGIGLGLSICKNLVEANGGQIEVKSEPGKGSTFIVYFPVCKEQA